MDSEWIIYTAGSNLRDILGMDIIDSVTTFTNNINEVYAVLGVEAARQALYNEITDVLVGVYVNFRHVALLIDVMTNKGTILSVNRHGINRGDIGPLAKCSFEETTDKLIKAGIFAEYDKLNGVAANVMLGQIPPCGTGGVELLIDETAIINMNEENVDNQDNDFDDDDVNLDELCMEENFTMKFIIPSKKEGVFLEKTHNNLSIM
jgi:DNA-directed RNA polymerase II subunit RPB1